MPLSPAERARQYRQRKAAQAVPTPSAELLEAREATEKVAQMSRASGVNRNFPLSVWKRAAAALIRGEGNVRGKVQALRNLCSVDKEWRKKVNEWVRTDQSEAVKKFVKAQGWELSEGTAPVSIVDRMVACLESGKALEDNFTAEEMGGEAPADPVHEAAWAEYQRYLKEGPKSAIMGCDYCGFNNGPATRRVGAHHYCDKHDGTPTSPFRPGDAPQAFVSASNPTLPASPSPVADPTGRLAYLQAIREVHEYEAAARARRGPNRATYGPTDPEAWKISTL